jgi:hypothetical protein
LDLDASDFGFAGRDRQRHPLKQREVDMDIQGFGFETGEAIGNGDKFLAQALQILQPLIESEVLHPVDTDLHPQEGAELLVHAAHEVLAVDAQHVMAVVELFEHAVEFAA